MSASELPHERGWAKVALLAFVLVSCLAFSGTIFGWAPLTLLLKEEGFYRQLCAPGESECPAQDNKLNLVYTLASTTVSLVGFPAGLLLDSAGSTATTALAAVFEVAGLGLMATADSAGEMTIRGRVVPEVFTVGVLCICVGGSLYMFSAFHATFMWHKHQPVVMACINCLFDGSTAVFAVTYFLHTALGLTRPALFTAFAAFTAVFSVVLMALWVLNAAHLRPAEPPTSDTTEPLLGGGGGDGSEQMDGRAADEGQFLFSDLDGSAAGNPTRELPAAPPLAGGLTFAQQVCTYHFFFIFCYCSMHILRSNFYLGTANLMLNHLGDENTGDWYTSAVGYIIPCGFAAIPFIGVIVERLGIVGTCQVVNVLGVVYNALSLVPSLPVQLGAAAVYTCYRAFVFSVISTFNAQVFGLQTLGRVQGLLFLVAALLNLLMNPVVRYTNEQLDEDYFWPVAAQLGLLLPLAVLTEVERRHLKKQRVDPHARPRVV